MTRITTLLLFILLLCTTHVHAEPGVIVRDCELKKGPSFSAKTLTTLKAGMHIEQLERLGGWQQIRITSSTKSLQGYVRTYQIRTGEVARARIVTPDKKRGVLSGLADLSRSASSLFKSRQPGAPAQRGVTTTIGVRGLDEKQLKHAKSNEQELAKMDKLASDKQQAKRFAKQSKLKDRHIDHLKAPRRK